MDRAAHQAWLKGLAEEDRRRRAAAEPELARKEARLRAERERLASAQAAIAHIEAELEEARREADDPDAG